MLNAIVGLLFTINIGADLGAMGDALSLLVGGPHPLYVVLAGVLCVVLQIFVPYKRYVSVLKCLTLSLFAYFGTLIVVHIPWGEMARGLFIPTLSATTTFWTSVVAILGTTISPYLFFWQASQEVEDVEASPKRGGRGLRPVAGRFAFSVFTLGILGTGLLAVPVLAGSAAYAIGKAPAAPMPPCPTKWPTIPPTIAPPTCR